MFIQEPDRTIVEENNRMIIRHNEVDRFAVGAREVHVERRGNQTDTVVLRPTACRSSTSTMTRAICCGACVGIAMAAKS